jgi:segregation and condensation protein B
MTDKRLNLIIEALLFSSDRPIDASAIRACLPDESLSNIKLALTELQTHYEKVQRSFVLKEVAQGYQFRTRAEYAPFVLKFHKASPSRLSKPALETLAIIAYKQPILRQEIERVRGVDSGGVVRSLLEKGLIRILGRKNLPGQPLIYGTTKTFLEVFDLKDLHSLPSLKEIKELGSYEPGNIETGEGEDFPAKSEASEAEDHRNHESGSASGTATQ